jgi:acyl-CoA reductase-like NAD-dependent aldehyde dehydrogenase
LAHVSSEEPAHERDRQARAAINDGLAESGYQQSGIGRLRGPLAITEFTEAKTVVHAIPPFPV